MNGEDVKNWFIRLLSALEERSIIVIDNASYNFVQIKKVPRPNWRKADIMEWLNRKNVSFSVYEAKAELQSNEKIVGAKKTQELDQLANEMGHQMVCLPPYHRQYNPIGLIRAQVKREVANRNTSFKLADVGKLTHKALDNVTQQDWERCVRHAEALRETDLLKYDLRHYSGICDDAPGLKKRQ
ncbi:uncharacterized protein LOC124734564 [Schistocerca piceifrons]|uniref:uncharacterized protein LOC124734564 n=1 Tax=Schistocerca piceifrons TaxID=274613 RepID=UPI001F5E52D6|nr:uncharacterized protein LOC124734564 [Schistocerca piceifrons]